ncbi:MAG: glycosyltransferase family 2 protein [Candidatus Limnocylindria bacterium]
MSSSFTVLVPVYNEAQLVMPSLGRIDEFMRSWSSDYEILVIESGSTDGSANLCDEAAAKWRSIRVIHEPTRTGYGSALRLGIWNATRSFLWVVTLDVPFPLESVFTAVPLLDTHDAVVSYRSRDPRGFGRRVQSTVYNLLLRLLLGLRFRHANSAFKVLRLSTVRAIPLTSAGWFIDAELLYRLQERGAMCAVIGVPLIDRSAGASTVRLGTWVGVLRELVRFRSLIRR